MEQAWSILELEHLHWITIRKVDVQDHFQAPQDDQGFCIVVYILVQDKAQGPCLAEIVAFLISLSGQRTCLRWHWGPHYPIQGELAPPNPWSAVKDHPLTEDSPWTISWTTEGGWNIQLILDLSCQYGVECLKPFLICSVSSYSVLHCQSQAAVTILRQFVDSYD